MYVDHFLALVVNELGEPEAEAEGLAYKVAYTHSIAILSGGNYHEKVILRTQTMVHLGRGSARTRAMPGLWLRQGTPEPEYYS